MVRHHNEDRVGVFPELGLFLVADGMGGAAAGEVAAQMAIDRVREAFVDPELTWPNSDVGPHSTGRALLIAAIQRASHCIHGASLQRCGWEGMGTTIAAVLVCGSRIALAHVGDSRVYRLRGRRLDALTEDHSLFNELVRRGLLDPDHPEDFEHRNIITRNLGADPSVEVEARWVEVMPADTFLLCSDGLSGVVSLAEMLDILVLHPDLEAAVQHLVARAKALGGPDNISAVLVRME